MHVPGRVRAACHQPEVDGLGGPASAVMLAPPARSSVQGMADRARWVRHDGWHDIDLLAIVDTRGINLC
jgi:hypothetical protein